MADVSGDRPWYEELAPDLEGDAGRGVEGSRVDSRRRVMAVWRGFEDSRAGVWLAEHTRLLAALSREGSVLVRRLAVGVLLAAMAFTLLLFAAAGGDPVAGLVVGEDVALEVDLELGRFDFGEQRREIFAT